VFCGLVFSSQEILGPITESPSQPPTTARSSLSPDMASSSKTTDPGRFSSFQNPKCAISHKDKWQKHHFFFFSLSIIFTNQSSGPDSKLTSLAAASSSSSSCNSCLPYEHKSISLVLTDDQGKLESGCCSKHTDSALLPP
jgi:hypothetical protein